MLVYVFDSLLDFGCVDVPDASICCNNKPHRFYMVIIACTWQLLKACTHTPTEWNMAQTRSDLAPTRNKMGLTSFRSLVSKVSSKSCLHGKHEHGFRNASNNPFAEAATVFAVQNRGPAGPRGSAPPLRDCMPFNDWQVAAALLTSLW